MLELNLGSLQPTPVQKLKESLNDNQFYIKRDDLLPISFGGNKVRKAILFFEDLERRSCDCVVTYGSSNSNHCRVIANIAASKELFCYIISPNETVSKTSNSQMMELFGANIIQCSINDISSTIENTLNKLKQKGYTPYFIEGGGHGNLGTQSYLEVYKEILNYEKEKGMFFDFIFHTSGTGTTQAGLICGQLLYGDNRKIIGISNARKCWKGKNVVIDSVNDYLQSIGDKFIEESFIHFIDDYILNGYGDYNEEILVTIKEILIQEGIPLDPVYTGKAFWGMKKFIEKNQIKGQNILFIHTGGIPLFFDSLEELANE